MNLTPFRLGLALVVAIALCSCTTKDTRHTVRVSVTEQKLACYDRGVEIGRFNISTSKFGLGDRPGSCATPLGHLEVAKKIGENAPAGMKFKNRRPTGEIVAVNAPGRDPIVTRILWLKGLEAQNARAYGRTIYIHGTPEESKLGSPASFGCVRMSSRDVIWLFSTIGEGTQVYITPDPLPPLPVQPPPSSTPIQTAQASTPPPRL